MSAALAKAKSIEKRQSPKGFFEPRATINRYPEKRIARPTRAKKCTGNEKAAAIYRTQALHAEGCIVSVKRVTTCPEVKGEIRQNKD